MAFNLVVEKSWEKHWKGMPEFSQEDLEPYRSIKIHFYTKEDVEEFSELIQQRILDRTKFLWYPTTEKAKLRELGWFDES